jgi:tetratricopeptide (TPR) repeat protein
MEAKVRLTATSADCASGAVLKGQRVALVGPLAGMSKREASALVREHGGSVVERPDAATLVVFGEKEPRGEAEWEEGLDAAARAALDAGTLAVIGESQLWQRLGLVDREQHIHSLYTPGMLAKLLGVEVSTLRRWQRRGWLLASREVRRLAYFDFQEVATARRLAELVAAGMSAAAIGRALATLARHLPGVKRPLAELSILVEGRHLLVRQGDDLVEPGGQLRFDFEAADGGAAERPGEDVRASDILALAPHDAPPATPDEMMHAAGELEEQGDLAGAAEMYRAVLAAGGPRAEVCFLLAELLYRMHEPAAARERYYMAIELDEDYVEARANLGCVLAELGERELAVSAFQGALAFHDDFADAHYHLARTLDELGRGDEAAAHWESFLRLAPSSPWADEARQRLGR